MNKIVSPYLWSRKSAPPGLRKFTDKHTDQNVNLVFGGVETFANTVKNRVNNQNNGTVHHLVDDFPLNSVHNLLDPTLIGIFKAGNGQYHISNYRPRGSQPIDPFEFFTYAPKEYILQCIKYEKEFKNKRRNIDSDIF